VKSFAAYYLGVVVRPRRTFDALMQDPRRLQFGAGALLVTGILYTLVYVFLPSLQPVTSAPGAGEDVSMAGDFDKPKAAIAVYRSVRASAPVRCP
jgi:hypothetical protein